MAALPRPRVTDHFSLQRDHTKHVDRELGTQRCHGTHDGRYRTEAWVELWCSSNAPGHMWHTESCVFLVAENQARPSLHRSCVEEVIGAELNSTDTKRHRIVLRIQLVRGTIQDQTWVDPC